MFKHYVHYYYNAWKLLTRNDQILNKEQLKNVLQKIQSQWLKTHDRKKGKLCILILIS